MSARARFVAFALIAVATAVALAPLTVEAGRSGRARSLPQWAPWTNHDRQGATPIARAVHRYLVRPARIAVGLGVAAGATLLGRAPLATRARLVAAESFYDRADESAGRARAASERGDRRAADVHSIRAIHDLERTDHQADLGIATFGRFEDARQREPFRGGDIWVRLDAERPIQKARDARDGLRAVKRWAATDHAAQSEYIEGKVAAPPER